MYMGRFELIDVCPFFPTKTSKQTDASDTMTNRKMILCTSSKYGVHARSLKKNGKLAVL